MGTIDKEKYKEVLEEEVYECVCENCSKPFKGIDEEATLCPKCWDELISKELEDKGK